MCRLDETYHVACGHWGRKRNVSPCAIGYSDSTMLLVGCWHSTIEGCSRVETLCTACKYRNASQYISSRDSMDIVWSSSLVIELKSDDDYVRGATVRGVPEAERIWLQRRLGLGPQDDALIDRFWQEERKRKSGRKDSQSSLGEVSSECSKSQKSDRN
jgi:hypothetical protein